jgi:hypothetical protein
MTSLHTIAAFAQRARTLIAIAMLALVLVGAPLAINAANVFATPWSPHIAARHYLAPSNMAPLADAMPNLQCGAIVLPC